MVQRKRFSKEFKIEAVRLMKLAEKPVSQLALELGVRRNQLYKWEQRLERNGEAAFGKPGPKSGGPEGEVQRLRKELSRVKEERDILKKAATYFARQRS